MAVSAPHPALHAEAPVLVIQPSRGWVPLRLEELWAYRELLYFFTWRIIKVRYKQTVLGAGWAVAQPLLTMLVFTVFFGRLAKVPSDGYPYAIFSLAALVPWTFFANALTQASNSLVDNERLLTKVYFPRLLLPTASVVAGLLDLAISFLVLLALLPLYGIAPSWRVAVVPLLVAFVVLVALGVGLWLAAVNVQYRDVRHVTPFLIQVWLFVTPVAYPSSLVPERWRGLYGVNPMAGVVEGFRWALLGSGSTSPALLGVSGAMVAVILVSGLYYFRRMERTFADVV
ncbi:MAG TPA: ABC transporter permease [Gemmatimonadales bacterium]|jgi:lipopolysaccharide transport system permease protein|nr:ABC transporter permease [Gemmatimonadales bacterium]